MEEEEIEEFLCELFCKIANIKNEFFENDTKIISYFTKNINNDLEIFIDGHFFNEITKAVHYLKINGNYKYAITINNSLDIYDEDIANKIYDVLLDEKKTKKENLEKIVKILSSEYVDDNDTNEEEEYIIDYCDYINCTDDETINERFVNDEIFAEELINSYFETKEIEDLNVRNLSIDIKHLEKSINPNNDDGDITFVNKIYRNIIKDIFNNVKNSCDDYTAIEFLISYFSGEILLSENFYKKYFGNINLNIKEIVTIQKLLIISDYYKLNFPYIDNLDNITELDNKLLKFIRDFDPKKIIQKFDDEIYFKERCITDFTNKDYYKSNGYYKKNEDEKTLKKTNPFYYIDKITKE